MHSRWLPIFFLQTSQKRRPKALLLEGVTGYILWVHSLNKVELFLPLCCVQYRVIFFRDAPSVIVCPVGEKTIKEMYYVACLVQHCHIFLIIRVKQTRFESLHIAWLSHTPCYLNIHFIFSIVIIPYLPINTYPMHRYVEQCNLVSLNHGSWDVLSQITTRQRFHES